MLEDPTFVLRDMTLENPIRAIRDISHDPTMKRLVRLVNGRDVSALDIQSEYLERAQRLRRDPRPSPLEAQALQMWEHCLTRLADDPLSLDREVDWVIKHKLIESYSARHELPLSDPRVALIDLQYHDIDRRPSLFYKMAGAGWSSG